jgi:hypothetical protein
MNVADRVAVAGWQWARWIAEATAVILSGDTMWVGCVLAEKIVLF